MLCTVSFPLLRVSKFAKNIFVTGNNKANAFYVTTSGGSGSCDIRLSNVYKISNDCVGGEIKL